ncbi:MAG: AraC family transcriptional regulator [Ferruginibacter sp.]
MKPTFETISSPGDTSFLVRKFEEESFRAPYHFHPQYELTLILSGNGKRYVGTHMEDYATDDLVLLGSNLPHCWKTENLIPDQQSGSVVIQFHPDFMGQHFFSRPEMNSISQLLKNSNYGIKFNGNISKFKNNIISLPQEKNTFKKLILLLETLHELALTPDYVFLNKQNLLADLPAIEKERLNKVIAYIVENFREKISLNQAAAAANMTPQAFCKYFKKISRKTFIEAVTDYRIDFAMQELVNTNKPVAQIGFESGFNDISNFYKTFKERLKISPLSYRNGFVKKL